MPGQITRRPYTDCPYTWTTTISGISSGTGSVGDRQCRGMNVSDYAMKFRACDSTGDKLIWVGRCFVPPAPDCYDPVAGRNMCDVSTTIDIPSFGSSIPVTLLGVNGDNDVESVQAMGAVLAQGSPSISGVSFDTTMNVNFAGGTFDVPNLKLITDRYENVTGPTPDGSIEYGTVHQIGGCPARIGGNATTTYGPTADGGFNRNSEDVKAFWRPLRREAVGNVDHNMTYRIIIAYQGWTGPIAIDNAIYGYLEFILSESGDKLHTYIELKIDVVGSCSFYRDRQETFGYEIVPTRTGYTIMSATYLYKTADNVFDYETDPADCEKTETATLIGPGTFYCLGYGINGDTDSPSFVDGFAPPSIEITTKFSDERNGLEGVVGADVGDRGNATWTLEYDIEEQLWTLHSFERIENPIYTLVDADPCVGLTKILTRVAGSGGNGCEVSPDTVSISRIGCPPNLSYRPRDARTRTQCARTSERKACDCQSMPIDERFRSIANCSGNGIAGCEDYGDDVKCRYPKNQLTCSFCGDDDIPCTYEALFGGGIVGKTGLCDIIYNETDIAASIVTLRQKCRFNAPCNWVAVGPTGDKRDGVVGHEPYCMLCAEFSVGTCASNCTWEAVQAGLCPDSGKPGLLNPPINILAKWGISWSLNVAEPATLTYAHPSFGVLIYTTSEDEPWLCDNVNTMYLTSQGDLPDGVMPESICVRPRYSGCGGAMDYDIKSIDYAEVEDQIACCDPACGSMEQFIKVMCCGNLEECTTTATAQILLLGRDSPAGPSYLASCTLHGVLWTSVAYCDGVRWKTDWYCKSPREFFVTTTHRHTCCPLTMSFEYWPDNLNGVKCCPVQECQCCDTSGTNYETLDMSITFPAGCAQDRLPAACTFSRPVTMTLTMTRAGTYPNHVWTVDPILCDPDYGFDMSVSCLNGTWSLLYNFGGGTPAAVCNPNSGTLVATNQALCPAILLEWTNPIVCQDSCVLVSNITITS